MASFNVIPEWSNPILNAVIKLQAESKKPSSNGCKFHDAKMERFKRWNQLSTILNAANKLQNESS